MIQYYQDHPEAREKCRQRTLELWQNDDYREKVTREVNQFYQNHPDMFKGEKNPFYGKKHTTESLEKIHAAAEKRKIKIARLDKDTLETLQIYNGIKEAERSLGVSHGAISKAARNDKIAYGFKWKII